MKDLKEIKKSINDSIDKVLNITRIEVDNFSTTKLKDEVIPILKEIEKRIYDIEVITENINGIRNEIITPVNNEIGKNSKKSNFLAMIGIISGLIGLCFTLYLFLFPKTMLSEETLTKIRTINANLVDEQVILKARELIKYNEEPKYEQNILLTYKTQDGEKAMEEYYNYLTGIGYKNVSKISPNSIPYYRDSPARNTIPYIYYRTRDVNNDVINGLEQLSKYYQSLEYGNIIAIMYYEQSTAKYVKWLFNKTIDENIELLIVL